MVIQRARICTSLVEANLDLVQKAAPFSDLFELRIDLVGKDWQSLAAKLSKPWIACNRLPSEGGKAKESERERIEKLMQAIKLGAAIIDLELSTAQLKDLIPLVKTKAECLLSFHDFDKTPPYETLRNTVRQQLELGADIAKVVTMANNVNDNLTLLKLIKAFPENKIVAFAMGDKGVFSRVMCPLCGGYFTYASAAQQKEAAPGQITAETLRQVYGMTDG